MLFYITFSSRWDRLIVSGEFIPRIQKRTPYKRFRIKRITRNKPASKYLCERALCICRCWRYGDNCQPLFIVQVDNTLFNVVSTGSEVTNVTTKFYSEEC
jgi:hypothetical protein